MELRNNPDLIAERVANGRSYIDNHRREAVVQRWETLLRGQNEGEG